MTIFIQPYSKIDPSLSKENNWYFGAKIAEICEQHAVSSNYEVWQVQHTLSINSLYGRWKIGSSYDEWEYDVW